MTSQRDATVRQRYFPAALHAIRLDVIGKEIDEVRAAMRLLGEGPPDDPIRRAGNMLGAISAAHFEEAARLREPEPIDEPEPVDEPDLPRNRMSASVKRKQIMILTVMTAILLLMSMKWIFSGEDHTRDHRTSAVTVEYSWDKAKAEREWQTQSRNGYRQDDAE